MTERKFIRDDTGQEYDFSIVKVLSDCSPEHVLQFNKYLEFKTFSPETVIVKEGQIHREMYFVLEGSAVIKRDLLEIGKIGPGNHFGELGLISSRPRAASVISITPLKAAILSHENYEKMNKDDPEMALNLLNCLVSSLGEQLIEMTDNVGSLLQQRSLPRRLSIKIKVSDSEVEVKTGTLIRDVLPVYDQRGKKIVAGLINNKSVSLSHPLLSDCSVSYLSIDHWEGERIYRKSAVLMFLQALNEVEPDVQVKISFSLGKAQWIDIETNSHLNLEELVKKITLKMEEYRKADIPFRHEIWSFEDAMSYFRDQNREMSRQLLETIRESTVQMVSFGNIYIMMKSSLVSNAGIIEDFEIKKTDTGLLLIAGEKTADNADYTGLYAPYSKLMRNHEKWLSSLGITSVGKFNKACISGEVSQLIRVSEGFHEKNICQIADRIAALDQKVRLIAIAGPSSSGKTTFIKRLKIQLQVNGIKPVEISLDDYYVNREETIRDEDGNYNFEAIEALNLELLREHISRIDAGEAVKTAKYNFIKGQNIPDGGPEIKLEEKSVLLIEGIHALNPRLLNNSISSDHIFRIFIQPMTSLTFDSFSRVNPSDLRLLRRIIRDRHCRGTTPAENIMRWPSVRKGEKKYIFPYVNLADVIFDTSLIYELSVLKVYGERYLLEVPQEHPAFTTAYRLRQLIDRFVAIYPDHVPPTSMLREFIGESGFEY